MTRHNVAMALLAVLTAAGACRAQAKVTLIAGADFVFNGNGPALNVALGRVFGLAVDPIGNVYVADPDNGIIAKITPAGFLTTLVNQVNAGGLATDLNSNLYWSVGNQVMKLTPGLVLSIVAGIGSGGYSGDGGLAKDAELSNPGSLAVDRFGNLYISDFSNFVVRKVDPAGIISTVAGNGHFGFAGDGGSPLSASIFPIGVAVNATGTLYIADGNRVRTVTFGGSPVINTLAGTDSFGGSSICVDSSGNVYISDRANNRIGRVSGSTVTVVAGGANGFSGDGGPAIGAALNQDFGALAVDPTGTILYIADEMNERIRKVSGGTITTFAGTGGPYFGGDGGPATDAFLNYAGGIAVDSDGSVFFADFRNQRIRKIDPAGIISTVAGNGVYGFSGDGGPAVNASLAYPGAVAVDSTGLYISDLDNYRIRKVVGNTIDTVAGGGAVYPGDGLPSTSAAIYPGSGLILDPLGNYYFTGYGLVQKVTDGILNTVAGDGGHGFAGDGGPAIAARFSSLSGIALDSAGNLYICDIDNNRIRKVTADASPMIDTIAGTGDAGFSGDGGPAASATFNIPVSIAVDQAGNVYVGDWVNQRIRKITPAGVINTVATDISANGLAVDSSNRLYASTEYKIYRLTAATPAPASLSPNLTRPGGSAFTLTIQGAGFDVDSVVQWNGSPRTTTYVSSTQVRALIPATDIANESTAFVTVLNPSLGGATSEPGTFAIAANSYMVGDGFPSAGFASGQFGDRALDNFDLIALLRAVTGIPGATPPACSDAFDALDSFPPDGLSRGGDGALDNFDLIQALRRVTLLDATRPQRASRGLACPAAQVAAARRHVPGLEIGSGERRVPVYYTAPAEIDLHGLSFSIGLPAFERDERLRFVPGELGPPTLQDDAVPGLIAVAWLGDLHVAGGRRILLGYVEKTGPAPLEILGGDTGR